MKCSLDYCTVSYCYLYDVFLYYKSCILDHARFQNLSTSTNNNINYFYDISKIRYLFYFSFCLEILTCVNFLECNQTNKSDRSVRTDK